MDIVRLRGIGVSPGIAMGEVLLSKRVVFTSRKELVPALPHRRRQDLIRRQGRQFLAAGHGQQNQSQDEPKSR